MKKQILLQKAIIVGLIFVVLSFVVGFYYGIYRSRPFPKIIPPPAIQNTQYCIQDSDCVVGIQPLACCSCPQAVSRNTIGTNDWQLYEEGKDYSTEVSCTMFCSPCQTPGIPVCQNNQCTFSSDLVTVTTPGTAEPEDPTARGLNSLPDLPVEDFPPMPISVSYLIDHRSALDGISVRVKGYVVGNWLDPSNCSPIAEYLCPQPRIFISDTSSFRNGYFNLEISVPDRDNWKDYPVGKMIEIRGIVHGDRTYVSLEKL